MCAQRYIRIGNAVFNKHKVLNVHARNSIMYIWSPYVLEIKYAKSWTETDYVNVGGKLSYSIPMETHHDSMDHRYKYEQYNDVLKVYNELKRECPNTTCSNEIERKN